MGNLTRRAALASAFAVGAATGLPAAAATIPAAPPFAIPPPNLFQANLLTQKLLRITGGARPGDNPYNPSYSDRPLLRLELVEPDAAGLRDFESFRELLFASFECIDVDAGQRTRMGEHDWSVDYCSAAVQINRRTNLIAARTKRGAGNTILYGAGDNHPWEFAFEALSGRTETFETTALNKNEIAILYHGRGAMIKSDTSIDGPFRVQMLRGGRVRAMMQERPQDYGVILRAV